MLKNKIVKTYLLILVSVNFLTAQGYQLVWSDEFNGRELDESIWYRETGGGGWGNEEIQYYTNRDTNAYVRDGFLTIQALEENYGGKNYTSARLITKNNKFYMYGKIEARIKLPYGQGIWPAFWMLGQNISTVGWPACGEIDILELIGGGDGGDNKVYGTAHWEQNGHASYGGSYTLASGIFADDFHLFTIEWTPQFIKWFVDGKQYHVIDITPSALSEFKNEHFIILNIAVGGTWPGNPDATTTFPQRMEIDYVRVYQNASKFPSISLIRPEDNNYPEYANIKIATDVNFTGEMEKVEFYQGSVKIGETDIEPYEMLWRNVHSGNYLLQAFAVSKDGYKAESNYSNIIVGNGSNQAPYLGSPIKIPGEFEAEDFDLGGSNVAFSDNSVQNEGFSYRKMEGVDIEACLDEGGGYNIGWTSPGEWLLYSIEVKEAGEYELSVRVASENSGGSFSIEIDNEAATSSIIVPNTGDWQKWIAVTTNIQLTEGPHTFKFLVEIGDFNVNRFELYLPGMEPQIKLIEPVGMEFYEVGSIQEIRWENLKVENVSIGLSLNGGSTWSFLAKAISAKYRFYRWCVPDASSNNCKIMIVDSGNSEINASVENPFSIDHVNSVETDTELKSEYQLFQNYPNPFNPSTIITYQLPNFTAAKGEVGMQKVKLIVYDFLGRKIATLVDKFQNPGTYKVQFNNLQEGINSSRFENLKSGIYFYKLTAGNYSFTRKMIMLK